MSRQVLALAAAVALLTVWGEVPAVHGQQRPEIRVRMQFAGPRTLDPVQNNRAADYFVYYNIFSSLVRWKPGGTELEPDLAERWETTDGQTWTFYLRRGVQFHKNYGELTAEDVKFSFERFQDKSLGTPNIGKMSNVTKIEVLDPYTIRFTLESPSFPFVASQVASHPAMIVSRKAVLEKGRNFGRDPIGTGPFIFDQWTSADQIVLVANDSYFRGRPRIARITFVPIAEESVAVAALERGDIHYMWSRGSAQAVQLLRANRNLTVDIVRRPGLIRFLSLNPQQLPALRDVRVRQALAYAINKQEIEAASGGQMVATEHILPNLPWLEQAAQEGRYPVYKFDPERARKLLADAGQSRLKLRLLFALDSPAPLIAQIVGEQFRRVGVDVALEQVEQRAWGDRVRKAEFEVTHVGIGRGADPDEVARELLHTDQFPPGLNVFRYDKADPLIEAAARERNPQLRQRIYVALLKQVMTDLPYIPLVNDNLVAAWRAPIRSVVTGIDNDFQGFTVVPR